MFKWLTCRHLHLFSDNINPGNRFGYWMFDLDTCIHLNEKELTVVIKKFEGTDSSIVQDVAGVYTALSHLCPQLRINAWGGCFF